MDLKRITKRREYKICIVIKVLLYMTFYAFYIVAKKTRVPILYFIVNFMLVALPCISLFYTILLIKLKCLSISLSGEPDINHRLEALM